MSFFEFLEDCADNRRRIEPHEVPVPSVSVSSSSSDRLGSRGSVSAEAEKRNGREPDFFEALTWGEDGRVPLDMLPTWKFISKNAETCIICSSNFRKGEIVRCLPCLHWYHKDCVDRWLATNMSCPVCKTVLPTRHDDVDVVSIHNSQNSSLCCVLNR
jgi:hypothetical protein